MSDNGSWHRRGLRTAGAVALLLAVVAGLTIAATTTYPVTTGVTFQTDSGLAVQTGIDINVESGNPFTNKTSLQLQNLTFKAQSSASLTVDSYQKWTNLSSLSVSGTTVTVTDQSTDPRRPVRFKGAFDTLSLRPTLNLSQNRSNIDAVYDASGTATLTINNTGLPQGRGVVAVDTATGEALESGIVDNSGDVTLSKLPKGTHKINIREGPAVLKIFKERKPTQLVDDAGELRIRFFTGPDSGTVVERKITDGTVSFQGLPQDESFVVTVRDNQTDKYEYRRVIVDSIIDQQEIYLLSTNATSERVRFVLDDQTGEFSPPSEVDLFVEKPITKDFDGDGVNETKYQTMVGDNFGASGSFPAVLRKSERYRLRARNSDGDVRVLGSYTVTTGGRRTVTIGQIIIDGTTQRGVSFGSDIRTVNGNRVIRVQYRDPTMQTNELQLEIYEYNNKSNVIQSNTTFDGPLGTVTATYDIPDKKTGKSYVIKYHADREGGGDVGGKQYVGDLPPIAKQWNMDPQVLQLLALVATVSLMGLVVILDDRLAAIVGVVSATAFKVIGAIDIPMIALGIAGAIAFVYAIARGQQ